MNIDRVNELWMREERLFHELVSSDGMTQEEWDERFNAWKQAQRETTEAIIAWEAQQKNMTKVLDARREWARSRLHKGG